MVKIRNSWQRNDLWYQVSNATEWGTLLFREKPVERANFFILKDGDYEIKGLDLEHIAGVYTGDLCPEFRVHVVSHFINIFWLPFFFPQLWSTEHQRKKEQRKLSLQHWKNNLPVFCSSLFILSIRQSVIRERLSLFWKSGKTCS